MQLSVQWFASSTGFQCVVCNRCRVVSIFEADALGDAAEIRQQAAARAVEIALERRVPLDCVVEARSPYVQPTYRIIHALRIDLGPIPGGAPHSRRELIVNLTRAGTNRLASGCRPRHKARIIDVRAGDEILHDGQWIKVHGVRPFLASDLTEAEAFGPIGEGYIYRVRDP